MSTFETSAGPMAYSDEGTGKAVVLLHGFPTSSFLWRNLAPLLATRFRVIVPDLIGYGASSKREDVDLSVTAQAGYVGELLDHLGVGEELAAVGHDVGGGVAQVMAFGGRAGALVLIDSITFDVWPIEGVRLIQAMEPGDAGVDVAEGLVRIAIDQGMSHKERLTEEAVEAFASPFTAEGGPAALVRAARGIDGVGLVGTEAKLAALGDRLLVLWGEDDPYLSQDEAVRLSDLVPGATVAILPGCSHYLLEDAPQTVGPLIYEWLRLRYQREPHHHAGDSSVPVEVSLERPEPPRDDSYFE